MNIQNSLNKIEVTLWDWIIKLMSTSSVTQAIIKKVFYLVREKEIVWLAILILAWMSAGIAAAYFIGLTGLR